MSRIRPIIRWPGSKTRLVKRILPKIAPHVCYCEPFAGSLAVLLAKERSKVEVVNDINGDLVALYRNTQYHLPELLREIEFFFGSRQNMKDFVQQPGLTELQRAARFLLRTRTSFAGKAQHFCAVKTAGGGSVFSRKKQTELLGAMHERLDNVAVEHLPYERCLKLYDAKTTFHFMDPPYVGAPTGVYDGWTQEQMKALRKAIEKLEGGWLLTVNDSDLNRALFADCAIESVSSQNRLCNNRTHSHVRFNELIITPK